MTSNLNASIAKNFFAIDQVSAATFSKPQRINPPRWIRRIRIKIQPTRIADRVFANKPPNPRIIVPIPIVVQPCFVIVVLTVESGSG